FLFSCSRDLVNLHSFPTRRSSDLEIAGRLSIQVGAWCLQAENGGRGILLGGASGVRPAKVVILGAGMSGTAACQVAAGMGAYVRSEEHTSELQSRFDLVCRLLLEK